MKHILLLSLLICIACLVQAQPSKFHEVRLGVGALPLIALVEFVTIEDRYDYSPGYSSTYQGNKTYCPAINLTYSYQFKKWLSFGAALTYAGVYRSTYEIQTDALYNKWSDHYMAVTPTVRFEWLRTPMVKLYSAIGLGIGCTLENYKSYDKHSYESYISVFPSFDITGFGLSVGRRFFGFGELSLGMNGFFKVGIGYRFNYKNER